MTSNLAGAWAALRQIGIEDTIPGYGQLLAPPGHCRGHGAMTIETASVDEDASPAEIARPGEGQSYLIGDTIYLRGAELGDAKWATAWRPTTVPDLRRRSGKAAEEDGSQGRVRSG